MYRREEIEEALQVYDTLGSYSKTLRQLGYPSLELLKRWVALRDAGRLSELRKHQAPVRRQTRTRCAHRRVALEEKWSAVRRCFEDGESVTDVATELGLSRWTIYTWAKEFTQGGWVRPMTPAKKKGRPPRKPAPTEGENEMIRQLQIKAERLQAELLQAQLERDILQETINLLKKDPGVDLSELKNAEKVVVIDALVNRYPLPMLLKAMRLSRSSYYYHKARQQRKDKNKELRGLVRELFAASHGCYGYRRIHAQLRREHGRIVSEKVVARLMKEEGLVVIGHAARRYSSYKGEISPAVENLLQRNFKADKPFQKLVTDLTQFSIPAGKVYLNAILDCCGLVPLAWAIGPRPDAELVNQSLDELGVRLKGALPILHSDRGCHYRWPGWIERTERYGITRSMSRKGCSGDNAACEGFFGILKTECFYGREFRDFSLQEFIRYIDDYIHWYLHDRIKLSLDAMSPVEYFSLQGYDVA